MLAAVLLWLSSLEWCSCWCFLASVSLSFNFMNSNMWLATISGINVLLCFLRSVAVLLLLWQCSSTSLFLWLPRLACVDCSFCCLRHSISCLLVSSTFFYPVANIFYWWLHKHIFEYLEVSTSAILEVDVAQERLLFVWMLVRGYRFQVLYQPIPKHPSPFRFSR